MGAQLKTGSAGPTEAWRRDIFNSPERIDVEKHGKSTTRYPVSVAWSGRIVHASGHERIALLLLEHLWAEGLVKRWKSQPLNLQEIGGPCAVPDILVELRSRELHVIEVKAQRFLTTEVQAGFDLQRAFLQGKGFGFHVWTNANVLSSETSHTVSELERGRNYPAEREVVDEIKTAASGCAKLGELTERFGWDDTLSAAAQLAFHFDITKPIHEETHLLRNHSAAYYDHLFARRDAPRSWWDSLPDTKAS
jgi:hypothetical protein